jgi:hypothetical protein
METRMAIKILDYRPHDPGKGNTIAHVDVEFPSGVRMFNMKLVRSAAGMRIYSPSAFGTATATFPAALANAMIAAASPFVSGEMTTNDLIH